MESDVKIKESPLQIIPPSDLNGSLNIFIGHLKNESRCIICLESSTQLVQNDRCSCIYHFHHECIEKLEKPNQCILCKKELPVLTKNNANEDSPSCCVPSFLCLILLIGIFIGVYTTINIR